ncbi:MOSC domain-containing protein [Methylocaldum sp. RMAD-M]|uniref:MOSC domain-containing protein n=1 Tax=unclassified Methylocaldum TaxID=2622260 RepID=UPI000A329923|nr:MOSC domain-containing protein [Methylocaldum sp. RMAD-M]MBP1149625.1 MOSC domain-containing protein YiiM [Methylocaldum sp. RMAD-M]MDV3242276.1 MOSC domain-containing protein [Methylocaldum sp.]
MELLAISLAEPKQVEHDGRRIFTGIYKEPTKGPVKAGAFGLEGDAQVDLKNHGGKDKAIYVYTVENYRFWERELEKPSLPFGQFGENFTVSGMPDESVHIGDVFRIGKIVVQVTQPRVPCFKLGIKMGDPSFVNVFLSSGRTGFYFRVLEEGEVRSGDTIVRLREDEEQLNIKDAMLAIVKGPRQQEIIEKALRVEALSQSWRESLEKRRSRP